MKIKSIRIGHANNSSSTHSIVFFGDTEVKDNYWAEDEEMFGWKFFTLSKRNNKELYLISWLFDNLYSNISISNKHVILEKIKQNGRIIESKKYTEGFENQEATKKKCIGIILSNFSDIFEKENILKSFDKKNLELIRTIDHQSVLCLPNDKHGKIEYSFLKEFFRALLENNFVILGGNDNYDKEHKLSKLQKHTMFSDDILNIKDFIGYEKTICYYDKKNNDYVLQKIKSGDKIRVSFDKNPQKTIKSLFPELVDISITKFCSYNCQFCYTSSTTKGKHGEVNDIKKIIDILSSSDCMEIAIGGGEPTTHPELYNILDYIQGKNILVGFTTKNYNLYKHKEFKKIIKNVNSIAFSCQTIEEIEKVILIKKIMYDMIDENEYEYFGDYYDRKRPKIYIQTILELSSIENLKKIFEICKENHFSITLLGYKEFGFGKSYDKKNIKITSDEWIPLIKKFSKKDRNGYYEDEILKIGIDSVIVKKWRKELVKQGVNKKMLVGEEGKFSCFIDSVNLKIASSSFTDKQENLDLNKNDILEEFGKL